MPVSSVNIRWLNRARIGGPLTDKFSERPELCPSTNSTRFVCEKTIAPHVAQPEERRSSHLCYLYNTDVIQFRRSAATWTRRPASSGRACSRRTPESLRRAVLTHERNRLWLARDFFQVQRVSERRAVDDFTLALVVAGNLRTNAQVGAARHQQARDGQAVVRELCRRMKDRRLAAHALVVDGGARVDVGSPIEEQRRRFQVLIFRGHVQKRGAAKLQQPAAGDAERELRKACTDERRIRGQPFGKRVEAIA